MIVWLHGRTDEDYFISKNEFNNIASGFLNLNQADQFLLSSTFAAQSGLFVQCTYQTVNAFTLSSNVYATVSSPVTSIDITIPSSMHNAMCQFTTGNSITYNFNFDSNMKISEAILLDTNTSYLISVDNNVVMWSELVDTENFTS